MVTLSVEMGVLINKFISRGYYNSLSGKPPTIFPRSKNNYIPGAKLTHENSFLFVSALVMQFRVIEWLY